MTRALERLDVDAEAYGGYIIGLLESSDEDSLDSCIDTAAEMLSALTEKVSKK